MLLAFDSHWQTSCQWHPCVPTHQPHGASRVPALLWPWLYDAVGSFGQCAFSPPWPRCSRTAETTIHNFILLHLPSPLFPAPCSLFPSSSARTKSPRDAPTCVTCPALAGIVKADRSARGACRVGLDPPVRLVAACVSADRRQGPRSRRRNGIPTGREPVRCPRRHPTVGTAVGTDFGELSRAEASPFFKKNSARRSLNKVHTGCED